METFENRSLIYKDNSVLKNINAPLELKKSILDIEVKPILAEISKAEKLRGPEEKVYTQLCFDYLYVFPENTHGFIQKLKSKSQISLEKARILAIRFQEEVLEKVAESLITYNIDPNNENIFFENKKLKITDKFVYYSEYKQRQLTINVSNIEYYKKFLSPKYIIQFEVFVPKEGSWGNVDRPAFVFSKEEVLDCADKLEKAISFGKFRLMNENIINLD